MHIKLQHKEKQLNFKQFVYITLPQSIYEELMHYINEFDTECSGCGLVEEIVHQYEDKTQIEYLVKEIHLPEKQDNSAGGTEYNGEEVAKYITDCVLNNKIDDKVNARLHWHSHADMSVFHSNTDEDNYDEIKCGEFLVSIVANKAGDLLGSIHYYKPMRFDVDSIPVYIETGDAFDKSRADANIAKVKEYERSKVVPTIYSGVDNFGYPDHYNYGADYGEPLYNRGDVDEKTFERIVTHLQLFEGGGEFEYIGENVIKDLSNNKYIEIFADRVPDWQGQELELEMQEGDTNANTE